ncbi:hypothetical protein MTO96_023483 [Rhipicephalus appendiculatus]
MLSDHSYGELTYDSLQEMQYLDACIKEAMRLCTPDSMFMPENKDAIRPFTYMPFGAGPRNCVGMRLGLLQAKTTLACLLQHVRFETCSQTMIPLKFKPGQLLPNFDAPLLLQAVPRRSSGNNVS